ncbi:response regulator [Lujinxingia vulgaris]|uniref:Response regulator n=1 Tax=Lujinxingia vulgaris TaxID=2600176 RepID=A0A5C6XGQ6_9DELT|nr:response regulator [Lujinxingia vulgaris]TXD38095.1 response regulator [Lujinxingia vulgaris]
MTQEPPDDDVRDDDLSELRRRHETLMRGLEMLSRSGAQTGPKAVVGLLDDVVGGDGGAVLQVRDDGEISVLCASDPRLESLQWWVGDLTEAVLEGNPLVLDDVRDQGAWQAMLSSVSMPVASVIMVSVGTPINPALWICVHAEPGRFGQPELERAQALRGLLTQAMVGWMAGRRWALMSHELRTPVNAMIGFAELLREEQQERLPAEALDKLASIERSGAEVLGIVSNLVSLAQLEAGDVEPEVYDVDVHETLDAVLGPLGAVAKQRGIEVRVERANVNAEVQCDGEKLVQLFDGVVGEAVRFSAGTQVEVELRADESRVTLRVGDLSPGRRGRARRLEQSVLRQLAELLGVSYRVERSVRKGTVVELGVPRAFVGRGAEQVSFSEEIELNENAKLVLIIDDDRDTRGVLKRTLERVGHTVVCARDGREGLRLASEVRPDVITLDVMMPRMDGWTVLERLKEDPDLRKIPVIMLTFVDDKQRGLAFGADHFMSKPVDRQELLEVMEAYESAVEDGDVLVVEDDEASRQMLVRHLEREGFRVTAASNGEEGLARLEAIEPSLVFLDLMMPHVDGFEFLQRFRERPKFKDVPVVVMTAKYLTAEDYARLSGNATQIVQKGGGEYMGLLEELRDLVVRLTRGKARRG